MKTRQLVWVGVLGPSATWAWQRLARLAAARPGATVDTVDLALSLGLGEGLGANAAISRTLGRLVGFGCAHRGAEVIAVRVALPDVPARQVCRLSASARLAHERLALQSGRGPAPSGPAQSLGAALEAHVEGVSL